MNHTPGPWTLLPDADGWTLHSNGTDITTQSFDCSDADARLIAAAPELLESLQIITKNFRDLLVMCGSDGEGPYISAALAAIAKANGE